MKLSVKILLLSCFTLWIQKAVFAIGGSSESDASNVNKWSCICYVAEQGNLSSIVPSNCYSSCNCNFVAGSSNTGQWLCNCVNDSLPKVVDSGSCFSSCNCSSGISISSLKFTVKITTVFTAFSCYRNKSKEFVFDSKYISGTPTELQTAKKRISSRVLIIIVLLCIALTALAFIASTAWYFYRKDLRNIHLLSSLEMQSSCNSDTSLISQRASPVTKYRDNVSFSFKPRTGCIPKASMLFRRETSSAIHGMIIEFAYYELEIATNKFSDSNLIGNGGSSYVYRGYLKDGKLVAIKRMKSKGGPDAESSFLTEIDLISRLHHYNVVLLLGYCSERHGKYVERLLVFEHMANGNLRDCLDGGVSEKALNWSTRVSIALGAARGLEYLHEAAAPRILHRDVKSTNVLLDENWRAKITDLGMAKHIHQDGISSCSSSPARMQGTFGYFAPEYAIIGKASLKSDVFSFGVVLLELITGRHAVQNSSSTKGEESLVIWASPRLQDSKRVIWELPDPVLGGIFDEEEMHVMAYLAKECLLLDPDSRPTMTEVVQILSTIAPDKSKRNNMSIRIFNQSSSMVKKKEDITMSDNGETEESLKYVVMQIDGGSSLPPSSHISGLQNSSINETEDKDKDKVDLTEPRFESFFVPNFIFH